MEKYFDDVHASKESQFYNLPTNIENSPVVAELKSQISNSPHNYDLYLEIGKLLNFQLRYRESIEFYSKAVELNPEDIRGYRSRAPRYITTLQFNKAHANFLFCEEKSGTTLDTSYRIGLCYYFMRDYAKAKERFIACFELSKNDFEMMAAVNYWYILCCVKLGETDITIPDLIPKGIAIHHHAGYSNVVSLFKNELTIPALSENAKRYAEPMNAPIALYGLYNYYKYTKRFDEASELLKQIIADDTYWICFAYIGAWVDNCALAG